MVFSQILGSYLISHGIIVKCIFKCTFQRKGNRNKIHRSSRPSLVDVEIGQQDMCSSKVPEHCITLLSRIELLVNLQEEWSIQTRMKLWVFLPEVSKMLCLLDAEYLSVEGGVREHSTPHTVESWTKNVDLRERQSQSRASPFPNVGGIQPSGEMN